MALVDVLRHIASALLPVSVESVESSGTDGSELRCERGRNFPVSHANHNSYGYAQQIATRKSQRLGKQEPEFSLGC